MEKSQFNYIALNSNNFNVKDCSNALKIKKKMLFQFLFLF
jgi:hypothetical protein